MQLGGLGGFAGGLLRQLEAEGSGPGPEDGEDAENLGGEEEDDVVLGGFGAFAGRYRFVLLIAD